MRRSCKFLLRPTKKQEAALDACLEDTRQLYNAALEERREAWRMGRRKVTFYTQDAQLREIRADDPARYGHVNTITAKREGGRWYVALSCDDAPAEPLEPTRSAAGIDMGLASFLTTSDGVHVSNPRHLAGMSERLAAPQRDLARKKRQG